MPGRKGYIKKGEGGHTECDFVTTLCNGNERSLKKKQQQHCKSKIAS